MKVAPYIRKTNYYETDQMGIIHHANYLHYFEEARVDFVEKIGYPYEKSCKLGIEFGLLSVNCEYKKMVRFGDVIEIHSSISQISGARMTVNYKILDHNSGELMATGNSSHFYYDIKNKKTINLRKDVPDLYALLKSYQEPNLEEEG
ncbi:MAG: thioesterase family protein [Sphaerochaetaceae bacterium]|nr:thioesterase family protein [Sphaerochaetaceae bacterium]